ncbi:methyltransferase family protein [Chloroflexota bacterium]
MIYIIISIISFLILHIFNIFSLRKISIAKPVTLVLGSGLLIYSIIMMSLDANKLLLPMWLTWLGWGLLLLSFFLLMYSLFISLPFNKTYIKTSTPNKLVTTGLFALVRHPWVLFSAPVFLSLILISKSSQLLIAAPILVLLNIALAIIQDKFIFDRMFAGYDDYRKQTPMLMPNRTSIRACISTIRNRA